MNINGLGSSIDLQPSSPYPKTAPDPNLLGQSGKTPTDSGSTSSTPTTTTYDLHNITKSQLLDLVENGNLEGGHVSQSGNAFSATHGSSLNETLLDIIGPPSNAAAANPSSNPGTIDLFSTLSNQINFLHSLGASNGTAAAYQDLLNTITSLTGTDGKLTTLNPGASL